MAAASYPVHTKRQVIAQVTVCCGCCCGNTERGLPAVPVDWLKSEWRKRGLLKRVQLTISGCVGPCDVPNVVVITTPAGSEWLGNLSETVQYLYLVGVGGPMQRPRPGTGAPSRVLEARAESVRCLNSSAEGVEACR